jgi:uncharacterized membrane protein YoaK (UPF0700 family)
MVLSGLMSFNGGLVDVACFFGLKGLFAAHITGNFATLCASVVLGSAGLLSKMVALPEFMVVVALTHVAGALLRRGGFPAGRILLGVEVLLLALFFVLAVHYGPFDDPDSFAALMTGLAAIAAMALQNAVQRVHLPQLPPTTFMTGNATYGSIDFVDVYVARRSAPPQQKSRFWHIALNFVCFGIGCAVAALVFAEIGFWSVALTVPAALLAVLLTP